MNKENSFLKTYLERLSNFVKLSQYKKVTKFLLLFPLMIILGFVITSPLQWRAIKCYKNSSSSGEKFIECMKQPPNWSLESYSSYWKWLKDASGDKVEQHLRADIRRGLLFYVTLPNLMIFILHIFFTICVTFFKKSLLWSERRRKIIFNIWASILFLLGSLGAVSLLYAFSY